jgi:DNA-binding transcriptional ArsR family regulator
MSSGRYTTSAYDNLSDPRARRLFDWLIRYSEQHGGRRASRAEMRQAIGVHRETLNTLLFTLESAGLIEFEDDKRRLARFYRFPDAKWTHPHLTTLAARRSGFYVGTLFDQ